MFPAVLQGTMTPSSRRAFALGTVSTVTALAGCMGLSNPLGGGSRSAGRDGSATGEDTGSSEPASSPGPSSSASGSTSSSKPPLADRQHYIPFRPAFLRKEVLSGGPGKDGIPAIDEPTFAPAREAPAALGPGSVVFGVVHDGAVKAYPQYVLVWHEIANDTLGDVPVSVTYCPLTGTVMGFERGETTFGVSGDLVNSNLVMYDRASDSRWPQMLATAIAGPLLEASLREFPLTWTTWKRWRDAHPDTLVLTEQTGYVRDYGGDPYGSYTPPGGYYADESTLFAPLRENDRYHPKRVVVGARTAEGALAFSKPALREQGLLEGTTRAATELATSTAIGTPTSTATGAATGSDDSDTDGGTPLLAAYDPALDAATVYRNPEAVAFEYREGTLVGPNGETYAPDALPLEAVMAYDAMWFAWAGFYPNTAVVE